MFLILAVSFLVALLVFAAIVLLAKYQALAPVRKLPGPKPNILFGNALQFARTPDGKWKVYGSLCFIVSYHLIYFFFFYEPNLKSLCRPEGFARFAQVHFSYNYDPNSLYLHASMVFPWCH